MLKPDGTYMDIETAITTDAGFRKQTIEDILSRGNRWRKDEARRRYEIYRDGIRKWVEMALRRETRGETVIEMMNRATNYNFMKKIVTKLARVYRSAVVRKVLPPPSPNSLTLVQRIGERLKKALEFLKPVDPNKPPVPPDPTKTGANPPKDSPEMAKAKAMTNQIQQLAKVLQTDRIMKKTDKFVKIFRNLVIQVKPVDNDLEDGKYTVKLDVLNPAQYDVIPDEDEPTRAAVIILSPGYGPNVIENNDPAAYHGSRQSSADVWAGSRPDDLHPGETATALSGDPTIIADLSMTEEAKRKMRFTWWSDHYHFTTDGMGDIKDEDPEIFKDNPNHLNPIGELPFISLNKDQDEQYWSLGGQDLADGTVLLNLLLTDLNYILFYQGMGVFYAYGDGIPDKVKVGPNAALIFKPSGTSSVKPEVGFASSNPPVEAHLHNIEQQLAILLSTNNLEPTAIASKLSSDSAMSGIHELIKRADVTDAIEDEQEFYVPAERGVNRLATKWMNFLIKETLADSTLTGIGSLDETVEISVEYKPPSVFMSETEKLTTLQTRLSIPLDTMVDVVKKDNPELSDEEAELRVQELEADFKRRQMMKTPPAMQGGTGPDGKPTAPPDPGKKAETAASNLGQGSSGD